MHSIDMDLKLNVQKRGLSTTAETINEEFTLHYGHIFKGEKGDKGADGKSAYQQAVEAGYKGSEEDFKELLLSYPNKADKDGYYPAMSVGVADDVKNGNTKYLAATPSGDPMHYVYLSYYGVSYDDVTGLYSVGYLKDLTADDMRKAFAMYGGGVMSAAYHSWIGSWGDLQPIKNQLPRTTLPVFANGARVFYDKLHLSFCWNELEQISLCYVPPTPTFDNCHKIWQYNSTETIFRFVALGKLRFIVDPLWCNEAHSLNIFNTLPVLEEVRIVNLQGDINFQSTPLLSKESLLYMINNCASGASFTITLHPDVYGKCDEEWLEDIDYALGRAEVGKQTNITLARA